MMAVREEPTTNHDAAAVSEAAHFNNILIIITL